MSCRLLRAHGRGVVWVAEGYRSVRDPWNEGDGDGMTNTAKVAVGAVMTVLGVLFMFQGLGYVKGSAMTGSNFWVVAGPVIAVGGLVVIAAGLGRLGSRSSRPPR